MGAPVGNREGVAVGGLCGTLEGAVCGALDGLELVADESIRRPMMTVSHEKFGCL